MKVFLRNDIEKVGIAGEIVNVADGYARNFLFPRNMAVEITKNNESEYLKRAKTVEHRKEVISTQTSMLAEKISTLKLNLKRKMHDDGKLYGAVRPEEIVELLAAQGVSVSKSQVKFDKSVKSKGNFEITIKLTSRLQPKVKLTVVSE